jgi:hypothetical protein
LTSASAAKAEASEAALGQRLQQLFERRRAPDSNVDGENVAGIQSDVGKVKTENVERRDGTADHVDVDDRRFRESSSGLSVKINLVGKKKSAGKQTGPDFKPK